MMAKKMKKLFSLILAMSMLLSLLSVAASAAEIGKTAKWADDNKTVADVKLSVPGDVEVSGSDIVFVVDKSSCKTMAATALQDMFTELAAAQAKTGTDIKVGLVVFNYTDHMDIPLTKLTSENAETLLANLPEHKSGTNMESGLLTAKKMLDEDTTVPAANKYVILISDGLTWIYDDENGDPYTMLHEYSEGESKDNPAGTISAGTHSYTYTRGVKYVGLPEGYTWDTYWEQIKAWVAADGDKFSFPMISNYNEQPFKDSLKTEEAKAIALTAAEGQDHANNMDRAMYDAWLAYTALQDAGYTCYANKVISNPNHIDSNGDHFMQMLAKGQKAMDFESIQDSIIHAVAKNSWVEDYIGYEAGEYNFDFVTNPASLKLTVNGVKYNTTQLTAKEGYTASYEFTAPVEGAVATFWLDYKKGDGKTEEMFKWTFGEDVSAFYPASLDYQVELVEKNDTPSATEYVVYTNQKATLHPVDSNNTPGETKEFPLPTLTYEIPLPEYTVTYKYVGIVPEGVPAVPAAAQYTVGSNVRIADDPTFAGYTFYGWDDPCAALSGGKMPAHDVTLTGYWIPVNGIVDPPIGIKTDKETDNAEYEVTVAVPGDGELFHDEVIIMMDGSYSGDGVWPAARAAILKIGETVLSGSGRTKLTLMAFGMADNVVVKHVESVDALKAYLPEGGLPGGLLYGRSSTNCEAGFTGVQEYITADEDLNDVYVIYISDGNINTDETPRAFDTNWRTWSTRFGALTVAQTAFEETLRYVITDDNDNIIDTIYPNIPDAFYDVFGPRFNGAETREKILERAFDNGEVTEAEFFEFAEKLWDDVYAYSGLTRGQEYPVSTVERAFVKYDKDHGTFIQDLFYCTTYKSSYVGYPNAWARTPKAATALAANSMVDKLYMIDTLGASSWMNPASSDDSSKNVVGANVSYSHINDISTFEEKFAASLQELSKTNYTNVVITDYMSKWVNLDPTSIYIKNDTTNEIIWAIDKNDMTKGEWKSETDRPTVKNPPVVVEKVDPADYEAGGDDVIGNMSGDIYKLTWYVKDDCLLRTDNYSLHYDVTVDVNEEGFKPGVEYPANGNTYVDFEENGHNDIDVPNVTIPAYSVTYVDNGVVLQKTDSLVTGTAIPGCSAPADYSVGTTTFRFLRWELTEGTEGRDGTVGTTDLVYTAVYEEVTTGTIIPVNPNPVNPNPVTPPAGGEEFEEPDVPLAGGPEEEFGDEDVPLAGAPEEEIFEEDVPLADVPATGDMTLVWAAASVVSAAGIVVLGKKRKDEE